MNSINPDRENTELSQNFNGELSSSAATPSTAPATSAALNWIDALLDSDAFVIVPQRCLSAGEKRDLIAKLLKIDPAKSDRQIAETAKASPTTVGTVRAEMEAKGDVSKLDIRQDSKGRKQPARKAVVRNRSRNSIYRRNDRNDGPDHGDACGGDHGEEHSPPVGSQAQIDELTHEVRVRDIKIHGLESKIADLKKAAAEAPQQAVGVLAAWYDATDAELGAALSAIGLDEVLRVAPHWKTEIVRRITDWPQGRPTGRNPLTAALRTALSHLAAAAAPQADVQVEELAALNALRGLARLNPNYHTLTITVPRERTSRRQHAA